MMTGCNGMKHSEQCRMQSMAAGSFDHRLNARFCSLVVGISKWIHWSRGWVVTKAPLCARRQYMVKIPGFNGFCSMTFDIMTEVLSFWVQAVHQSAESPDVASLTLVAWIVSSLTAVGGGRGL